jgi:hypothetical protein
MKIKVEAQMFEGVMERRKRKLVGEPDRSPFVYYTSADLRSVKLTVAEKTWLGRRCLENEAGSRTLGERYNLNPNTLRYWSSKVRQGVSIGVGRGRPRKLDDEGEKALSDFCQTHQIGKEGDRSTVLQDQFLGEVSKQVRATTARSGSGEGDGEISGSKMKGLRKDLNIKSTMNAQVTTEARKRNLADPRNYFSHAAYHAAYIAGTPAACVVNMDASQFSAGQSGHSVKSFYIQSQDDEGNNINTDRPLGRDSVDSDTNPVYVKTFQHISAQGTCADHVYIIADDKMGAEEMHKTFIPGLACLTSVRGGSWVVLMKTRKCNAAFWKWLSENVSFPFMVDSMKMARAQEAVMDMDGEFEQIAEFTKQAPAFKEKNITLAKGAASFSKHGNSLDSGAVWKAAKKKSKHSTEGSRSEARIPIRQRNGVTNFIGEKSKQTTQYQSKMVEAIMQVTWAFTMTMSSKIIIDSFIKQRGLPTQKDIVAAKLGLCSVKVSTAQVTAMEAGLPTAIQSMKRNGEITEVEMDDWGIDRPKDYHDTRAADKDKRAPVSRRVCIMTNPVMLANFTNHFSVYGLTKEVTQATSRLKEQKTRLEEYLEANVAAGLIDKQKEAVTNATNDLSRATIARQEYITANTQQRANSSSSSSSAQRASAQRVEAQAVIDSYKCPACINDDKFKYYSKKKGDWKQCEWCHASGIHGVLTWWCGKHSTETRNSSLNKHIAGCAYNPNK